MRIVDLLAAVGLVLLIPGAGLSYAPGYGGYYSGATAYPNSSYLQGYQCPHESGVQSYGGMMGSMPMGGYGYYGAGSSGWFPVLLLLIAAAVLLVYYTRGGGEQRDAKDILDMRLARGEISLEEYQKLREVIER